MNIWIIRHADSISGHSPVMSGIGSCEGLTAEGHRQADEAARALQAKVRPDLLVSSPVRRARETGTYLSDALKLASVDDCSLCEIHLGDADGLTHAEYEKRFEPFDLLEQPDRAIAPGGESWNQFKERVRGTMDGYAETHRDSTVMFVSHAGFIMMSILALFDVPRPGTGAFLDPRHCAVTSWRHDGTRWYLDWYNASAVGINPTG